MGVLSQLGGFGSMGTNSIENEIEILKSKKLIYDVVEDMGLQLELNSKKDLTLSPSGNIVDIFIGNLL